jgi:TolA-binding protein
VQLDGELRRDVYWLLGEAYAALGKDGQAVQFYRLLLRHYPDHTLACDAAYRLAHSLREGGNNREAARYYQLVAGKFPQRELAPKALFASAACLLSEGLEAEAARDWATLIGMYPESGLVEKALYQKALAEVRLGRDAEALTSLRELFRKFPKTALAADGHYWSGMLLLKQEKAVDAQKAFDAALAAKPRAELERDARYYRAVAMRQAGKPKEAVPELLALVATPAAKNFTPPLLLWLAETLLRDKQFDPALRVAELLLRLRKEPEWQQTAQALKGRALLESGRDDAAAAAFRAALAQSAQTRFAAEAALRLGEIALERGRAEEAAEALAQAAALSGSEATLGIRAEAYAALAEASRRMKKLADAARYYMSVAILYDDPVLVPACLEGAMEVFRQLGDEEQARKAADELLARYPKSKEARRVERAAP